MIGKDFWDRMYMDYNMVDCFIWCVILDLDVICCFVFFIVYFVRFFC